MLKIIACGLIIAVGWFIGGIYADFKQKSYMELCGLMSLLEAMKSSISYSRAELYGIFAGFSDKALDYCGFTAALQGSDFTPANEVWRAAVDRLSVGDNIKDVLSSFGSTLGVVDCETQLERLDGCIAFLAREREDMRAALAGKVKSYRYLGALTGCLTAIILY